MATKSINKIGKNSINSVKNVNKFVIDTTEMIVDETLDRTADWQKVTEKAIHGGFKMVKSQSDLTFKALETLKRQLIKGQERLAKRSSK